MLKLVLLHIVSLKVTERIYDVKQGLLPYDASRISPKPPTCHLSPSGCWNENDPQNNLEHHMLKRAE